MKLPVSSLPPCGVLAAALLLCASSAATAVEPWDPAGAWPLAAWTWDPPQSIRLPGARMQVRYFRASLDPVDAARQLVSAGSSRLGRLQFSGPVLSLSGMRDGQHWLAQLRPAGSGTIGLLTSLGPETPVAAGFDPGELVPPGAQTVLRASSRLADGDGLLATYVCPGPHPRVAATVRNALLARRWRPLTDTGNEWIRSDGARLTVHIRPRADAVSLTFWHRTREAS